MADKIYSQPDHIIEDYNEDHENKENNGQAQKNNSKQDNSEKKNLEKKLKKYEDLEGLTTKKLNFGLWYAEHAIQIKRFINITLILISFASWGFTIYNYAYYYFFGIDEDEKIIAQLTEPNLISHTYFVRKSSQELALSNVSYLKSTDNKYDLYIKIQNTNKNYWAEFEYCFSVNGIDVDCGKNFILPKESKHIMSLSQEIDSNVRGAIFNIKNIVWRRINPHEIADWDLYKQDHANFIVDNISFTPPNASGLSEKLNLSSLEFTVTNETGYSYWDVGFNILLYRGNSIVGVNRYKAEEFMSGETRNIIINWPGNIIQVSGIDIEVEVNILDNNNYIKPEGGIGEIK